MTEAIGYARFQLRGIEVFDPGIEPPSVVVYDVGDAPSLSLELKLRQLPHRFRFPTTLVLRGVSSFNQSELQLGGFLRDMLADAAELYELQVSNKPRLLPCMETPGLDDNSADGLLRAIRHNEILAMLHWTESIWRPTDFHFILPSGEHSDTFVRLADVFSESVNVSRIADWCLTNLSPRTAILADTPTLLPLVQELELRAWQFFGSADFLKASLREYHPPIDEVRQQVLQCVSWLQEEPSQGTILVLVSVSASGSYIQRLSRIIESVDLAFPVEVLTICSAGATPTSSSLVTIENQRHNSESCGLCERASRAIEIDQKRFITRVVSDAKLIKLPSAAQIESYSPPIEEFDTGGALKVHVDRPGHHDHLSVYIDTAKALQGPLFRKATTTALLDLYSDGMPDLAVLPLHEHSDLLGRWLLEHGIPSAPPLPPKGDPPSELDERISVAKKILVCDDAVMTTKTMRALLQHVQRVKGSVKQKDYDLRVLALIARTEDASSWAGLKDRFFVNHTSRMRAAWTAHLPAPGRGCPWCYEVTALMDLAPRLEGRAREGIEQRIERLRSGGGLRDHLYLGSEAGAIEANFDDGKAVTPQSYYGNLSGVGGYIAAALMIQQMRNDWKKDTDSIHMRFVIPTATYLRRFTDPVFAAGLFRAAKPRELWSAETTGEVIAALNEVAHLRQHPVFYAEAIWASARGKLPPGVTSLYNDRLDELPEATASWLRHFLME